MRGLKQKPSCRRYMRFRSHLLQMRGLKPVSPLSPFTPCCRIFYRCVDWNFCIECVFNCNCVASFTDAWIETNLSTRAKSMILSHLLQMRGLKHILLVRCFGHFLSHLLQMRGLKQVSADLRFPVIGRIFYRCVDWNICRNTLYRNTIKSHLLQMRGLKHS